ncbi:tyrosine-type recombinase/integrase [Aliiroseovarius sp. PrR006]|uniref:tyrosine-type recombinase/integrase n=1 Tax=Aliiroseovarius sp. PrR006 TaxID=2706883 RepID=UPI0013CFE7EE|nr:tyrosine-type recombinase/integrase [Aliiroseovarius sp. PrR006]NDW53605.1 tyrosine-type recombinase/integrase [Aliiroseovarius sp. PrR006]
MSYGVSTVNVHKKLKLDKRSGSDNWYARLTLDNGKRIVKSTKTDDLEEAKERAIELYYETEARIKNNLPAQTRKFKHVAEHAIKRMQDALENGTGKLAYKDYISALRIWLIPYFGSTDVDKIDLAALTKFDAWRTEQNKKPFSQSGINNHNAALNRVLDEAELQGWLVKSMRPTLLNKGVKSESRGSFTDAEYKKIYTALRTWHEKTDNKKAAATREVLRNYVLFLANTGIRQGKEALGLRWRNIEWQENDGEKYLVVNVDGKTRKRSAVARDTVEGYLDRQSKLNSSLSYDSFSDLVAAKSDEHVFTTRLGQVTNIASLNRAFNALLDDLSLKVGADGKSRTLYSLRHYYATRDLKRGMSTHALSKQMGTGTTMIDKHYSKFSPILNAEMHSGRDMRKNTAKTKKSDTGDVVGMAFDMLANGKLDEAGLLAALGVERPNYVVTDEITIKALEALGNDLITDDALMRILKG